jgi:hypothetical protein
MAKGTPQLSPQLVTAREELGAVLTAQKDSEKQITLEDKLQVIDRLIKMEALEHKIRGNRAGAAFDDDEEEGA